MTDSSQTGQSTAHSIADDPTYSTDSAVVIVGGGFAGVACAQRLAKHDVSVTLLDQNNYHQFQPLLYQVATAQVAAYDIARPLRGIFRRDKTVEVRRATGVSVDPVAK